MNEKNKIGRPLKYDGEELIRTNFRMRERYKRALEMVAQHRSTSMTEAVELAIAVLCRNYQIDDDGTLLSEYVLQNYEVDYFYISWVLEEFCFEKEDVEDRKNKFVDKIINLDDAPESLLSKFDLFYKHLLINWSRNNSHFFYCFNEKSFYKLVLSHWKTTVNENDLHPYIYTAILIAASYNLYVLDRLDIDDVFVPAFEKVVITPQSYHDAEQITYLEPEFFKKISPYFEVVDKDKDEDLTFKQWWYN